MFYESFLPYLKNKLLQDKDGKDLDLSLLDHEDWEDDHVHQMTVDQILAEITLLDDSDSDEEVRNKYSICGFL